MADTYDVVSEFRSVSWLVVGSSIAVSRVYAILQKDSFFISLTELCSLGCDDPQQIRHGFHA
jgi:hypothetical protein